MIFYTITDTLPVVPDWSSITGDLKAGTPISIKGAVANDEAAIGLVAGDTAHGAEYAVVVTAGVVDLNAASASYGSTISDDVVQALDNVTFIYGGKVYAVAPSELPAVTSDDKDKFLHTNGSTGALEWTEAGGGGGMLVVTFGGSYGLTPDKTVAEIAAAASAGQLVVFKWSLQGDVFVGIADITLSNSLMTGAKASAVNSNMGGMLSTMTYQAGSWSATEIYLGS